MLIVPGLYIVWVSCQSKSLFCGAVAAAVVAAAHWLRLTDALYA